MMKNAPNKNTDVTAIVTSLRAHVGMYFSDIASRNLFENK